MKRRHRRVLFNLFAFSLLGVAIYLNIFRMNDENEGHVSSSNNPARVKSIVKETRSLSKTTAQKSTLSQP